MGSLEHKPVSFFYDVSYVTMDALGQCQDPKRPGARLTQYRWLLPALLTTPPNPHLQTSPAQGLPFPELLFPINPAPSAMRPLGLLVHSSSFGLLASPLFSASLLSLPLCSHGPVQSGLFQIPLAEFSFLSRTKPLSSTLP